MITKKSKKRLMVYIFLWIQFIIFNSTCADNIVESMCADPIEESHLGLQWFSKGLLGQHLAIDFVAPAGTEVRAIADGHMEHNYANMRYYAAVMEPEVQF